MTIRKKLTATWMATGMLIGALMTGGCATSGDPETLNAAGGGVIGGALGAGAGALIAPSGSKAAGAAIGGVAGAAGGAVAGYKVGESVKREKKKSEAKENFLQQQIAQARAQNQQIQKENARLKTEIGALRQQYDLAAAAGPAQESQVRSQIQSRVADVEKDESKVEEKIAQFKEAMTKVDPKQNERAVSQLEQEIRGLEAQSQSLQARRDAMAKIVAAQLDS